MRSGWTVVPALVAGIHVFLAYTKTWMAGSSPAMTEGRINVVSWRF
jgi:hypothetical protein